MSLYKKGSYKHFSFALINMIVKKKGRKVANWGILLVNPIRDF